MLKVLLFGAGAGSITFMENNQKSMKFLGYIDNDPQKQGEVLNGLTIFSPSDLVQLKYDQIVITTHWAIEVQDQLLNKLNISPEKVVLPAKNQLKKNQPFAQEDNIALARMIVKELSSLAIARNIPLLVDFGTLLGIVRDKDILPWDDDVDFSVPLDFSDQIERLLKDFVKTFKSTANWYIDKIKSKKQDCVGYLLKFSSEVAERSHFTTSICFREFAEGNAIHMPSLGMWYAPEHHFRKVERIMFGEVEILVPAEFEDYLEFLYGDWKTPRKNMKLTDYENLGTVEFDDIEANRMTTQQLNVKDK